MLKTFNVNGQMHEVDVNPDERLSDMLQNKLGLIGVRVSCSEGECGSCTILVDGKPVTSCLMLAMQAEGKKITTIEGLGTPEELHPIQEAFIEKQGFQCGFCTPGIIMSTKAFLDRNPDPSEEEASKAVSGSICRCGAYPYIVESVMESAQKIKDRNNTSSVTGKGGEK